MPEDNEKVAATSSPEVARSQGNIQSIAQLTRLLPIAGALVVVGGFAVFGIELGFLVMAGVVLTLAIFLMWSSVQSLTGGSQLSFDEALGMGAPSRTEEQKRSVLRALKDLEYERSVGKISPADYAEFSNRYREEAKRLIQALDETLGPARARAERTIERHLERAGLAPHPNEAELAAPAASTVAVPDDEPARVGAEAPGESAESAQEESK